MKRSISQHDDDEYGKFLCKQSNIDNHVFLSDVCQNSENSYNVDELNINSSSSIKDNGVQGQGNFQKPTLSISQSLDFVSTDVDFLEMYDRKLTQSEKTQEKSVADILFSLQEENYNPFLFKFGCDFDFTLSSSVGSVVKNIDSHNLDSSCSSSSSRVVVNDDKIDRNHVYEDISESGLSNIADTSIDLEESMKNQLLYKNKLYEQSQPQILTAPVLHNVDNEDSTIQEQDSSTTIEENNIPENSEFINYSLITCFNPTNLESVLQKFKQIQGYVLDNSVCELDIRKILTEFDFTLSVQELISIYFNKGIKLLDCGGGTYCLELDDIDNTDFYNQDLYVFFIKDKLNNKQAQLVFSVNTKRTYLLKSLSQIEKIDFQLNDQMYLKRYVLNADFNSQLLQMEIQHSNFYVTSKQDIDVKSKFKHYIMKRYDDLAKYYDLNLINHNFELVIKNIYLDFYKYRITDVEGSLIMCRYLVKQKNNLITECLFLEFFCDESFKKNRDMPVCFDKYKCSLQFIKDNLKLEELQYRLYDLRYDKNLRQYYFDYQTQREFDYFYSQRQKNFPNVYFCQQSTFQHISQLFFTIKRPSYVDKNFQFMFYHDDNSVFDLPIQYLKQCNHMPLTECCFLSTINENMLSAFEDALSSTILYDSDKKHFFTIKNSSTLLPSIMKMIGFMSSFVPKNRILVCNFNCEIQSHLSQKFLYYLLKRSISNQKCHLHVASNQHVVSNDSQNFTFLCLKTQDPDFYKSIHKASLSLNCSSSIKIDVDFDKYDKNYFSK
ncbi:hypothetical protein AB837_00261 [bacterium AB1]|nr:hypothetical protein AB837_00261 [bacterium AB1]